MDYDNWLADGDSLATGTVVLDPAFTATVTDVTITAVTIHPDHLFFTVTGGAVNEAFTVDVQVHTSRSEVKNDTAGFRIVAP